MAQSNSAADSGSMVGGDVRKLLADLLEMLKARRELAQLELQADVATSKRLALFAGIGAVLILAGLPVAVMFVAQLLYVSRPIEVLGVNAWIPLLAGLLIIAGLLLAWSGYRRFRREFLGLRQSLDEFREDVQWLREWTQADEAS